MATITFNVSEAFRGASPPAPWFRVLENDPPAAATQLLFGAGNFSTFQSAEPVSLALQWLREVRDPSFAQSLDSAFATWIDRFWGDTVPPESAGSATVTAGAWQNLCLILVGYAPKFPAAAAELRRVLREPHFLLAIGEGPALDPAGRALQAISRYQNDLSLRDNWWETTALPEGTPWFHGEYAVEGLCHLPGDGLAIPTDVPAGLRRLADGLCRRVGEGWLDAKLARRHFLRVAQLTQRRFPFEERWRRFWLGVYQSEREETVRIWAQSLWGFSQQERDEGARRIFSPDPAWPDRAKAIGDRLASGQSAALQGASALLAEQQAYLNQTGDSYYFVRTSCNFASRIKEIRPEQALAWVRLARLAEPANPFPWTIEVDSLRRMSRHPEASARALEAVARFPNDVVARNGLRGVLKALAGHENQTDQDPDSLAARGDSASSAPDFIEPVVPESEPSSENPIDAGNSSSALDPPVTEALVTGPSEPDPPEKPPATLASPDRAPKPTKTAEKPASFQLAPSRLKASDSEILLTDFILLRKWSRSAGSIAALRDSARTLLNRVGPHLLDDAVLASEGGHTLLLDDVDEAIDFLREAGRRFPGSAKVAYARANAERLRARRLSPHLDSPPAKEALLAWNRLSRVDPVWEPLQLLGLSRTLPLLRDGAELQVQTRRRLGELASRTDHMTTYATRDSLEQLWAQRVRQAVFAGEPISHEDQLGPLNSLLSRLEENQAQLDGLESQYVDARAVV